jgi:hypothetical protein
MTTCGAEVLADVGLLCPCSRMQKKAECGEQELEIDRASGR